MLKSIVFEQGQSSLIKQNLKDDSISDLEKETIEIMDEGFCVLQKKEIYEFLNGDGAGELIMYNGQPFGLPYHTTSELCNMCRSFGYTGALGGSRWNYMEALFKFAIEKNRCSELLSYIFSLEQFHNLNMLSSMTEIEHLHQIIVTSAIDNLNSMIRLSRKELQIVGNHFYIVDVGKQPVVQAPRIDAISVSYVRSLRQRCEEDLLNGNFDSVVTKSRTLMEETLIYILEQQGKAITAKGDLIKLYSQVKSMRNMKQNNSFDLRVNDLLSGLDRIVNSIANMRNTNSDAHGVGANRITIKEKEARLIMNAAISFCEYMLS